MFGGLYCPSSCGWYCRYPWAQQRAALPCRRGRPPLVRSVGKLLSSSVVLILPADYHMYNPLQRYPLLYFCWGRCCPFFIRLVRKPLMSYPSLHYSWGGYCPFFTGWLHDPLLCYPPPSLLLGQMPPDFYTVGV